MVVFYLLFIHLLVSAHAQVSNENLPDVHLQSNNLDDSITQIFNHCKCVIFYLCDEQNNIIPPEQVNEIRTDFNYSLRNVRRLRCSNDFYYCCRNASEAAAVTTTSPEQTQMPYYPSTTEIQNDAKRYPTSSNQIPYDSRPYPAPLVCGHGGSSSTVTVTEFPWVVAILQKKQYNNEYTLKCGGTLIHPRVVLTAHHCVVSSISNALRVVSKRDTILSVGGRAAYNTVTKIIKHESYYSGGMYNDVALVILDVPITSVEPVCLPNANQNFVGRKCTAVGWGPVGNGIGRRKLRKVVDLPIVDSHRCQNLLRNTSLGSQFKLHSSFLCAGGEKDKDTCIGDGGGPLMCQESNQYFQVGIVSWGLVCGQKDVPSSYTDVAKFINWIDQKLMLENINVST